MDIINIHHCKRCIDVEVNISNQRFVFLKYGTASEPLPDYLPIKVLPLDQDGFGKYELPCKNMIPEAATHVETAGIKGTALMTIIINPATKFRVAACLVVFASVDTRKLRTNARIIVQATHSPNTESRVLNTFIAVI